MVPPAVNTRYQPKTAPKTLQTSDTPSWVLYPPRFGARSWVGEARCRGAWVQSWDGEEGACGVCGFALGLSVGSGLGGVVEVFLRHVYLCDCIEGTKRSLYGGIWYLWLQSNACSSSIRERPIRDSQSFAPLRADFRIGLRDSRSLLRSTQT
jgi:hypothetical protein